VEHPRGVLVAVRDAHQRVGLVGVDHVLDGVGDDLARGQRVRHAAVAHGDAVVQRDGVEFAGHAAGFTHGLGDDLTEVLEVDVSRYELGVGVGDRDDGLAEVAVGHTGRAPQGASSRGVAAVGRGSGAQSRHIPSVRSPYRSTAPGPRLGYLSFRPVSSSPESFWEPLSGLPAESLPESAGSSSEWPSAPPADSSSSSGWSSRPDGSGPRPSLTNDSTGKWRVRTEGSGTVVSSWSTATTADFGVMVKPLSESQASFRVPRRVRTMRPCSVASVRVRTTHTARTM